MTERSFDDVYSYEKQALDLLAKNKDHPHYTELRALLIDQINDELHDIAHSRLVGGAS